MSQWIAKFCRLSALILGSLVFLELILQILLPSLPQTLTQHMPQYPVRYGIRFDTAHGAREYPANQSVDVLISPQSGDLYEISCLSRTVTEDFPPYRVQFQRDRHGFRNNDPWPLSIDTFVVGDSFTAAEAITNPYWKQIAGNTVVLGLPGSGTVEQALLIEGLALPQNPERIIWAYFGGNDLADSTRFLEAQNLGENLYTLSNSNRQPWEYLVTFHIALLLRDRLTADNDKQDCIYPIQTTDGERLAFYNPFISQGILPEDELTASEIWQVTRDAITRIADASHDASSSFVVVYIPPKEAIYSLQLDDNTWAEIITPHGDLTHANRAMDAQAVLLAQLASEQGFAFLDLTDALTEAVEADNQPYFFADTHWNQTGHEVAGQVLAAFLNTQNSD